MRNATVIVLTALFLMAVISGCSKSSGITLDASGKHPSDWVSKHAGFFRQLPGAIDDPAVARSSACVECHGSDLRGGTSKVSCFSQGLGAATCHFHPVGFGNPANHGVVAKGAPAFNSGLDSCRGCHGSGYTGGLLTQQSCFPCHGVNAPHAANWATSTTSKHSDTNPDNAAACAQCHTAGNLLTNLQPPPPQPAGTPPGCFNATLCHGQIGHPAGWIDPAQHGATAKSQPGSDKGFTNCQLCHGANFSGGVTGVSCFTASRTNGSCHLRNGLPVNAPHAALPWRAAAPNPTHTSTVDDAQGLNAGVCAQCHLRGANLRTQIITTFSTGTPGCFNATLCHGQIGHPLGWANPSQHGATGKANLTFCQTCHADKPTGGAGSNPRFNVALGRLVNGCEDCHEPFTAHPPVQQIPAAFGITSPDPLGTPWFRHRTATNFVDVCDRCHGVNLAGGNGPRCQNCHVGASPISTINSPDPCSSCHSQPPSGTSYPNNNRVHGSHKFVNAPVGGLCAECHSGLGSGTLDHFLRAKNVELGNVIPSPQTTAQPGAVVFGGILSRANGSTPVFDPATLQCSNTYCHGNTLDRPASAILSPSWGSPFLTGVAASDCVKCHGYPPQTPSHTLSSGPASCINCHSHVNSQGTGFGTPSLHINGSIEATSTSAPHAIPLTSSGFPGSLHKTASFGTGCRSASCHPADAAGAVYPAATLGTAPNCRACHLSANPTTDPRCTDCHGNSNTGQPVANAFPNRAGEHGTHGAIMANCDFCHFGGGTGVASHGNSGGTLKTVRNVTIAKNPALFTAADTISIVQNPATGTVTCTGSCHIGNDTVIHSGFTW